MQKGEGHGSGEGVGWKRSREGLPSVDQKGHRNIQDSGGEDWRGPPRPGRLRGFVGAVRPITSDELGKRKTAGWASEVAIVPMDRRTTQPQVREGPLLRQSCD